MTNDIIHNINSLMLNYVGTQCITQNEMFNPKHSIKHSFVMNGIIRISF